MTVRKLLAMQCVAALFLGWLEVAWSAEPSAEDMRSLDDQVQEIKTDVLAIAAELTALEEQLLFPSNTQVAVFLSLEQPEAFRLDAIQLTINGDPAAHHIYSFKELDALASGGVQRVYTGNLAGGEHGLSVTVIGKLPSGKEYRASDDFIFQKGTAPKLLGIELSGPAAGQAAIALNDW